MYFLESKNKRQKIGSYQHVKSSNYWGGAVNSPKTIYLSLVKGL